MTFEIARRLVACGHSVEWFSAMYPGAQVSERLDGVDIVRCGQQWTVHWHAFRRYRKSIRANFDVVVDEVNTVPFFAPLWAGLPVILLIYQLAREVWWYESPFPLSAIGYTIEPFYLRIYRSARAVTISRSTEADLRSLGFRGEITIVPIGIETIPHRNRPKTATPSFVYVGRLAASKRLEHMLRAFALYRRATGAGELWLVGIGHPRYQRALVLLARRLRVDGSVVFWGHVSAKDKYCLMQEAHALLMTSLREGWGLVVTEANACGTPTIAYDVPGLRDSVRDQVTGLLTKPDPLHLCNAMVELTTDPVLYKRLAEEGLRWSATFSFDETARLMSQVLESVAA